LRSKGNDGVFFVGDIHAGSTNRIVTWLGNIGHGRKHFIWEDSDQRYES